MRPKSVRVTPTGQRLRMCCRTRRGRATACRKQTARRQETVIGAASATATTSRCQSGHRLSPPVPAWSCTSSRHKWTARVAASGLDNYIVVRHADGTFGLYGHITHEGADVREGDNVGGEWVGCLRDAAGHVSEHGAQSSRSGVEPPIYRVALRAAAIAGLTDRSGILARPERPSSPTRTLHVQCRYIVELAQACKVLSRATITVLSQSALT